MADREPVPNPDVVVKRTIRSRAGNPVRLMTLCTVAAEEWCVEHGALDGEITQLARSLVVPKARVPILAGQMRSSGLIVTECLGVDHTVVPLERGGKS